MLVFVAHRASKKAVTTAVTAFPLAIGSLDAVADSLPDPEEWVPCAVPCVDDFDYDQDVEQEAVRICSPWRLADLRYKAREWAGYREMECRGLWFESGEDGTRFHLFRRDHLDGSWGDYVRSGEPILFQTRDKKLEFRGRVMDPKIFGSYHVLKVAVEYADARRFREYCSEAELRPPPMVL